MSALSERLERDAAQHQAALLEATQREQAVRAQLEEKGALLGAAQEGAERAAAESAVAEKEVERRRKGDAATAREQQQKEQSLREQVAEQP